MKQKITQFRWLVTMLLLVAAMAMPKMAWAEVATSQPQNGDGSAQNPYQITTAAELAWFRDHVNAGNKTACARLEADIDMSSVCHAANESKSVAELSWEPITDYSKVGSSSNWYGTFDGNNKTISNLYINTTAQHSGLFGYIYNSEASERGSIKNIKFENVSITSTVGYLGVLAGTARNTDISGITVNSGTVNGKEYCGGIVGEIFGSSLSGCINKINVVGSSNGNYHFGGIVGHAQGSSSITNCANYGNVKGYSVVGGIAGKAYRTTIENVFSSGDVTCFSTTSEAFPGLVVGYSFLNVIIQGHVIYNSEAKLSYGTTPHDAMAFGYIFPSTVTESDATGMTKEQLKNGWGTWLLNSEKTDGLWGQTIGSDDYPVLSGSKIYPGNATRDCLFTTYSGSFSNTESDAVVGLLHSTPTYHPEVDHTCKDGNVAYYECNDCHKTYKDEAMTILIENVFVRDNLHHDFGADYVCTHCGYKMPVVGLGDIDITVDKADDYDSPYGYNLFKYVADGTGTLYVKSYGDADIEGTLWTALGDNVEASAYNDDENESETDFSLTYEVTQGETYFIGVRQKSKEAISGNYILRVRGSWTETADRSGITHFFYKGDGTSESPFLIKTASDLVWFRDYVNAGNKTACARLEADIDMSSVCHAANESEGVKELSWVPISDLSQVAENRWSGTFDGNNKTISNLYINTTAKYSGLFGYIHNLEASERGTVKNIKFENVSVTSTDDHLGVLAGFAWNIDISGITVNSGTVNGTEYCGGIVGYIEGSSLSGCINKINIFGGSSDGNNNIGGIVGCAESSSSIANCANYGNMTGYRMVGGIAGSAAGTTIENVFSSGAVYCIYDYPSEARTGLVVGEINENVTISGNVIYNSEANLSYGTKLQAAKAFGYISSSSTVTESDARGMTSELLATGKAAYLLNGSSPYGKWGQQIEVDSYPVPGSDKTVYCGYNKDNCLEKTYSNNQEELSENPVHHYDNGFCKDCDAYQPATLNASGEYEIGNAGQLYWFAALVNGNAKVCDYNETDNPTGTQQNRAASAVLTADITVDNKRIWTPIGCDESGYGYEGTFDGQFHTIKGLYYNGSASQGIGLFSQLESGTIQNVGVSDFSFSSTNNDLAVAGICAYNFSGTIKNCFCIGEIHSGRAGGVCAHNESNLSDCYFSGKIVDETNAGNVGGVCYYNRVSISNCYHNIDLFPGKAIESDWGYPAGDALGKTTAEFASGEVAYLLQGNQSEAVWGQTIDSEPYPVFRGAKVYEGYVACIKKYSNSELSTTPTSHDYSENGICNTCHAYKRATLTTDKYDIDNDGTNDNVYEISNVGQLYWFAALVNGDTSFEGVTEADGTANARLMNDIIVNANVLNGQGELNAGTSYTVWTPIGNSSSYFRGIFDGAGHSVSGLYINDTETDYVGFFAYSRGTIKNVGVVDSYIKGNEYVAGVCAYNMSGTISNCYNEGTVCGGGNYVGGVCSESYGGTVTNCYNAGAVSGTGSYYVGGLCGDNYSGTITYSFNRGQVSGGYYVGDICGRDSQGNIKNCYYLSGTANTGIGFENDGGNVERKTAEQFARGEVCYMLNGYRSAGTAENPLAWYQNLSDEGGDAYPVYTRTETNTVYGGYDHGKTELYCGNNIGIATDHPHAHGYDSTAEDEASGNHDKSYEAKFEWTDNEDKTSASVTARFTCQVCNQELTPEVTAVQDQEHSKATATCTEDAQNTYTTSYSFTGAIFTDTYKQVITPALGHDLTEIKFSDTYNIYFNACKRKDCGHKGYYAQSDGTMPAVFRDNYTGYVVEKADITDATAYTSLARFTVDTLNYTRKFSDDKWMAVYVPFVIDCDILDDEYEMAVINNFHEYEQEDGSYKVVLEVKRVTRGGTIPALTPCLIRMKTAPEAETSKTLTFTNVAFEPAAQKYIDCASMTSYYKFLGTLNGKDGFNEATDYVLSNGILYKAGNNTHLYPQRWYLSTSLISNGSISSSAKVRSISIGVIGDGDTTGIEEVYVNTESCADADSNSAIYDLQGRKLSREPQKGIYIKNGVKLVK